MQNEIIRSYFQSFESSVHKSGDVEIWFARDLQKLLGYSDWRNFLNVIDKAKIAFQNLDQPIENNFADVTRAVEMPNGATKEIDDILLTRYACYLIAQNGDSSKEQISFAMNYFAVQTRKQEILEKRIAEWERLQVRDKLTLSEKELSGVIYERGVDNMGFAIIRSKGDEALFGGNTTNEMKNKLKVPKSRPLADFLPTITIKAKDFANEITIFNLKKNNALSGQNIIANEHIKNNRDVRGLLTKRGIYPEALPAEEDVKKVERRIKSEDKKILAGPKQKKK